MLANEFNPLPYLFSNVRPPGAKRWGKEHKDFQMKNIKRMAVLQGPIQEIPNFEARVTVDPSVTDHWGIPVVAMSGSRHPIDYENCKFLSSKAEMVLKEAGAYQTWQRVGGRGLGGRLDAEGHVEADQPELHAQVLPVAGDQLPAVYRAVSVQGRRQDA